MGFLKEFRDFAMKGSVVDLAVGVIIGIAFGAIVKSMVDDVLMPPLGFLMGGVDFADKVFELKAAGPHPVTGKDMPAVVIGYGKFLNALIAFIIQALAIFVLIKLLNSAKRKPAVVAPPPPPPPTKEELLLAEIRDILKARG
jgi:large conductance mechanosensitive channel